MGFLNNLLNREAQKIINGVADSVTNRVTGAVRDAVSNSKSSSAKTPVQGTAKKTTFDSGTGRASTLEQKKAANVGEEDCCHDAALVCSRIQTILTENFSGCELRKQIPASEIGAADIAWQYTYGVYRSGRALAMINILDNPNDYRRKIVLQSKQACANHGIGYVHFLLHLPNRSSYISEQLKKIIPA